LWSVTARRASVIITRCVLAQITAKKGLDIFIFHEYEFYELSYRQNIFISGLHLLAGAFSLTFIQACGQNMGNLEFMVFSKFVSLPKSKPIHLIVQLNIPRR